MTREIAEEMRGRNERLIPVTHYEVNESSTKAYQLHEDCPEGEKYVIYIPDDGMAELQHFRSQWTLRRRR